MEPEAITLTTELQGRTAPYGVAEVRPQVSGIIQRRLFAEGTAVSAGAPLYRIDPAPYETALPSDLFEAPCGTFSSFAAL